MRSTLAWSLSLVLHAGGLALAAYWAAADLVPEMRVAAGRTAIELQASIEAPESWERPREPVLVARRTPPIRAEVEPPAVEREHIDAVPRRADPPPPEQVVQVGPGDLPERREPAAAPGQFVAPQARPKQTAVAVPEVEPVALPAEASVADAATQGAAVDELPEPLPSNPSPAYRRDPGEPSVDRRVVLYVVVGPSGRPTRVELHEPSGSAALDHSVLRTVRDFWRFRPAYRGGRAVSYAVKLPFVFRVGGG